MKGEDRITRVLGGSGEDGTASGLLSVVEDGGVGRGGRFGGGCAGGLTPFGFFRRDPDPVSTGGGGVSGAFSLTGSSTVPVPWLAFALTLTSEGCVRDSSSFQNTSNGDRPMLVVAVGSAEF